MKFEWLRAEQSNGQHGMARQTNRIFAVCYKDRLPQVVLSGGWGDYVMACDVRSNKIVRSIQGPHIAGQSLDCQDGVLLTGSWRNEQCLETWDFGTAKRITKLQLKVVADKHVHSLLVYQAKYAPDSGLGKGSINVRGVGIACGSGANCAALFDVKTGAISNAVGLDWGGEGISGMIASGGGVYCVDMDPRGEMVLFGGSDGRIGVAKIVQAHAKDNQESEFLTQSMLDSL